MNTNITAKSIARYLSVLVSVVVLSLFGCQQSKPIEAAIKSENVNGNGFDLTVVYQTDAPLIIAHVEETQKLYDANGNLVRTFVLDYWEWFTPQNLPGQGNIPNDEWQRIQHFQGKNVVMSDAIRTGPGMVASNVNAPAFRVVIERTHTLYTGGTLNGQGNGAALDRGNFGILETDQNGNHPSATYQQGQQPLDITNQWRQGKTIQGQIANKGAEMLKIRFTHEGRWQQDNANPPYSVHWRYERTVGQATPHTTNGSNSGVRPQVGP